MTQGSQLTGRPEDAVGLTNRDAEVVHRSLAMVTSTSTVQANLLLRAGL